MPPPVIALAGIMVSTVLYGIYTVLFVASIYLLLNRHNGPNFPRYSLRSWSIMFYSSCALFVIVTGHWIVNVCRAFTGFIYFHDGAVDFFKDGTQPLTTAFNVFVGLAFVVGDSMIIYRLWIVWGLNKLVIILPVMSVIALAVSYSVLVVLRSRLAGQNISATKLVTPTSILTMVINIYCTALIAYRIWTTTRGAVPVNQRNLMDVLAIVVESAALYTTLMVVYEITYQLGSQVQYAEIHFVPPIIGIANALIQVRVGLRESEITQYTTQYTTSVPSVPRFAHRSRMGETTMDSTQAVELKSVAI
ncbi:hypothetical protein C8J57DRAFT_1719882 [Mycena rebaudengoi]|nr:hypothetical protein C8J57DRAFT_1719882 [Mycena rebaudengoi]